MSPGAPELGAHQVTFHRRPIAFALSYIEREFPDQLEKILDQLEKRSNFVERLLLNIWHVGIDRRIAYDKQQEGSFVVWSVQDLIQKAHWAGGMSEGG